MRKFKPIVIVAGEPNSIFLEIFFKSLKKTYSSPIILIASYKLLILQMKKLNYKKKIKLLKFENLSKCILNNKAINLIDVNYTFSKPFEKISSKSNSYIKQSFDLAFKIIDSGITNKLINGPISKKNFLKKKYLGITEYLSKKTGSKKEVMLIYNKKFSVSPITTHQPLSKVSKNIKTNLIVKKVKLISNFYKKYLNKKIRIAICGLNPHCETVSKFSEEDKIIKPAIKILKKNKIYVRGPLPADTLFLKQNLKKFDVFVGMYHDQVLTPIKALVGFNAINVTLGLPFVRISPDHGPNSLMYGKNKSNPESLKQCLLFLKKIRGN